MGHQEQIYHAWSFQRFSPTTSSIRTKQNIKHAVSYAVLMIKCMILWFKSRKEEHLLSKLKLKLYQRMPRWSQNERYSDALPTPQSSCVMSAATASAILSPINYGARGDFEDVREGRVPFGTWRVPTTFSSSASFATFLLLITTKEIIRKVQNTDPSCFIEHVCLRKIPGNKS